MKKPGDKGLYAAIHAKQERIKNGSKERMRTPGSPGAPTSAAFKASAKTVKNKPLATGGRVKSKHTCDW
jgi:hypothetical protein